MKRHHLYTTDDHSPHAQLTNNLIAISIKAEYYVVDECTDLIERCIAHKELLSGVGYK